MYVENSALCSSRITSYNVCYTKLLRFPPCFPRSPVSPPRGPPGPPWCPPPP
ncbi:hypothetical protein [Streptomyces cyaneogriseus]|uniref:hypothetical protein n=1 Tax=Streptomyces cyaneogriseus TaxID=68192 RepID=UPI0013923F6B|nr:hypothetical protein [Streptomyces cyaneogriseus]